MSFALAVLSALIPVVFWYFIIIRENRKEMKFFFFLVFFLAFLFAFFFKKYEPKALTFFEQIGGIFLAYFVVGGLLEYGKNFILRFFAKNYFKSIDDVVDLAFATALGFTFMENIFVFHALFHTQSSYQLPVQLLKSIIVQGCFILPIHLLSSGIFGYYYGLSLFAKPEIKNHIFFSSIQILKGSVLSMTFYGLFFWLNKIDFHVKDVARWMGYDNFPKIFDEQLLPLISFIFFFLGTMFLFYKLEQKHFLTDEKI